MFLVNRTHRRTLLSRALIIRRDEKVNENVGHTDETEISALNANCHGGT